MNKVVVFDDLDKMISENIDGCVKENVAYFDGLNEEQVSDELNDRIINLIADKKKEEKKKKSNIRIRKLLVLAAVIATFFIMATSVSASNPILDFLIEKFGHYFIVDTNIDNEVSDDFVFTKTEPSWLPEEDYEKEILKDNSFGYIVNYKFANYNIFYSQTARGDSNIGVGNTNSKSKTYKVDQLEYLYIEFDDNQNKIQFFDNYYFYEITSSIERKNMEKIMLSIFNK